ncbi:MAG: HAD-IIIA family hydrolase [Saprospiraceae bacterium]|nr:HAD-IIIA family hydrolase [Saprospiraceae bacterium]
MKIDDSWTLFLDRDGVINQRIRGNYVKVEDEFIFNPHVLEAMALLSQLFSRIIVVTNQQGVGLELMTQAQLDQVHDYMCNKVQDGFGRIDLVLAATEIKGQHPHHRKPSPVMGHLAKEHFPDIDFERSIMVGDSESDMLFGKKLLMKTVLIKGKEDEEPQLKHIACDYRFSSLYDFAKWLDNENATFWS